MRDGVPATGRPDGVRLRPTVTLVLVVAGAVIVGIATVRGIAAASRPLGWVVACSILALVISGFVDRFATRMPRPLAVAIVMLALAVVVVGSWVVTIGTIREQLSLIGDRMTDAAARFEQTNDALAEFGLSERVGDLVDAIGANYEASALAARAAGTASTYVVTGVLLLFFVASGPRFVRSAIEQVPDDGRRDRVARVMRAAGSASRRHLTAMLGQFVATAVLAFACFRLLDIELAYVSALGVAALGAIPTIGYLIALPPAMLVAAGEPGWAPAIVVAVFLVALQAVEIAILRPRIAAWSGLAVGPAIVLIGALIGHALYELGGAVYGAALAVILAAVADGVADEIESTPTPEPLRGRTGDAPSTAPPS